MSTLSPPAAVAVPAARAEAKALIGGRRPGRSSRPDDALNHPRDHKERENMTSTSNETIASHETNTPLDELGPVDYVVVEFPAGASNFTGEMAAELLALVEAGTIRVIDVLILTKDEDGSVDAMELGDIEELGELQALEAQLAELLAEEDVVHLAAAMEPGSTAGVLIYENLWAAPFASAARRSGGQLIANGRIPIQAIIASIEADEALATEGV
jgi:Family of unknown function (DUF6325)